MKDLVKIDGRRGEGGGQVLRSSIALSVITGRPLKVTHIRARRKRPGLLRQHLTAVKAAAEICGAQVEGAELGSKSLTFVPGPVVAGEYSFKIGTAGSTSLVLQTILPPLMLASGKSHVTIEGGTHNMMAPPFDFIQKTFAPILAKMGVGLKPTLDKWGFYPAGGGRVCFEVSPVKKLKPLNLCERGDLISRSCLSIGSAIPQEVCEREVEQVSKKLNWKPEELGFRLLKAPCGPGNVLLFELEYENLTEVFTAFGEKGLAAEKVAAKGISLVRSYLKSKAVACEYLADQLLLPIALSGKGSFTALSLSSHTLTNMEVIKDFLDVDFETEKISSACFKVSVK